MTAEIELIEAVAGQKNKASDYNTNFTRMKTYIEDSVTDLKTWTNNTVDLPITTLDATGTIALSDNSINRITPTAAVTFTLPVVTSNTKFHQILVQATLTNTSYLTAEDNGLGTSAYFYDVEPSFAEVGNYDIIYEFDGADWVVGVIRKGSNNAEE